jgi:hypothetical protein
VAGDVARIWKMRNACRIIIVKHEGIRKIGTFRSRCEGDWKKCFIEFEHENLNRICLLRITGHLDFVHLPVF